MERSIESVAIVGAGPAGGSLAAYLAQAGVKVALFDAGGRPEILVGESLVPATIAFIRKLGLEEEVAAYSTLKVGASFTMPDNVEQMHFRFDEVPAAEITYAYNVPLMSLLGNGAGVSRVVA